MTTLSPASRGRIPPVTAALAALALSGCASTELVQLWRDPGYKSHPVQRVFVFAAVKGEANRAQFEGALADALIAKGFQVATATSALPPGRVDKHAVKEYIDANKVDLLVMMHLTTEKKTEVRPTTVTYGSGWYGAYGTTTVTTGSISETTSVMAQNDVFDVRTEPDTLVWSGQSSSFDMQSAAEAARSLAPLLVNDLMKAGILVK